MKFQVQPLVYTHGYCATKYDTLESALCECEFLEESTPLCWAVVPLTEDARKEYDNYLNS